MMERANGHHGAPGAAHLGDLGDEFHQVCGVPHPFDVFAPVRHGGECTEKL